MDQAPADKSGKGQPGLSGVLNCRETYSLKQSPRGSRYPASKENRRSHAFGIVRDCRA